VITPAQVKNQQIFLTQGQQHYLSRVLRLGKGDRFIAMDGQGSWWLSEIEGNLTQAVIIQSLCVQTELPVAVTLIIAMPKGSGFEQVVSQATELGVTCIVPVKSDRTLLNPSPQKLERWRRLSLEAAEQSERQIVPTILDPIDLITSLQLDEHLNTDRYLCVARGEVPHFLSSLLDQKSPPNDQPSSQQVAFKHSNFGKLEESESRASGGERHPLFDSNLRSIVIATGPEGGWTDPEVAQAIAYGFQPVSLGRRILRAVTAPIVALSLVASVFDC
jgi:16S rRNA (uracil1498-N3)-methyltransferase